MLRTRLHRANVQFVLAHALVRPSPCLVLGGDRTDSRQSAVKLAASPCVGVPQLSKELQMLPGKCFQAMQERLEAACAQLEPDTRGWAVDEVRRFAAAVRTPRRPLVVVVQL